MNETLIKTLAEAASKLPVEKLAILAIVAIAVFHKRAGA